MSLYLFSRPRARAVAIAGVLSLVAILLSPVAAGAQDDGSEDLPAEIAGVFGDITEEELVDLAESDDSGDDFVGWFAEDDDNDDPADVPDGISADTGWVPTGDDDSEGSDQVDNPAAEPIGVVPSDVAELNDFVASDGGGVLIVTLRTDVDGVSADQASASVVADLPAAAAAGVTESDNFPILFVPPSADALDALLDNGLVANVEADRLAAPSLIQVTAVVNSDEVNAGGVGGRGLGVDGRETFAVAVLDTGVDLDHGAFDGRIVSEACYARGSDNLLGAGDCPNGSSADVSAGAGNHCTFNPGECRHGTHVAGIAVGNEPTGAPAGADDGVAPNAQLVPINVFSDFGADGALSWTSDQIRGLDRVETLVNNGTEIRSANMSLGGGRFFNAATCDAANVATKAAIDSLRAVGVATVIAAGNDGWTDSMSAPACISTAISVGATTDADGFGSFTNSDTGLDFWAPGVGVFGPVIGDNAWATLSGTSMSTPVVSGAYALLVQCGFGTTPRSIGAIETQLDSNGVDLTRAGVTAPRIDVLAAAQGFNPNDVFADAEMFGLTLGQTITDAETNRCGTDLDGNEPGEATTWYRINPAATGTLELEVSSNFNTQLRVYTAPIPGLVNSFADLDPLIAFDEDSGPGLNAALSIPVNGFKDYWVQVDGFANAQGDFDLEMSLSAPPTCAGVAATIIHDYADNSGPWVYSGANDVVFGSPNRDRMNLSGGNDIACLFDGDDFADGGDGVDTIFGGDNNDVIEGGVGVRRDFLSGSDGDDTIRGEDGDDILTGNAGDDEMFGGNGRDRFTGGPGEDRQFGGNGDDVLRGNGDDDFLSGEAGNDLISANAGDDELLGGSGEDDLRGGNGADILDGGADDDELFGQPGDDEITGGDGDDLIFGFTGNDEINGGNGNDDIRGQAGNDTIVAGSGNDVVTGGNGNDSINGGTGFDDCNFGSGVDTHPGGCEVISNLP